MNNMRRGFTLIELIFVILIIGILAAVALPKFLETAQQAHNAAVESFTGTLNRTVGATMWAKSIKDPLITGTNKGKITTYCPTLIADFFDNAKISEITGAIGGTAGCEPVLTPGEATGSITFVDGNASTAPVWTYAP